jgi:integrase
MSLSDAKLRSLKRTGKRYELPDRDGLTLRVSKTGVMTWTVTLRIRGASDQEGQRVQKLAGARQRIALGEYPTISLALAREQVTVMRRLARAGKDPRGSVPRPQEDRTIRQLIEKFAADLSNREVRSAKNIEKLLHLHLLPVWGERDVASIGRGELVELFDQVRVPRKVKRTTPSGRTTQVWRGGPGAAAELRRWTRSLFQYAVDLEFLVANPFDSVRNRERQRSRTRVLSMEELRAVWQCAQGLEYPFGPYFQLLILTGARRSEWACSRREWLDPLVSRLEIPAHAYKTDRPYVIPLSALARRIITKLPAHEGGPYLFSTTAGEHPISGFSKAKARIDTFLDGNGFAEPWVTHDLRRTMATHMERLGIAPHVIEACLGHSLRGIAAVYRRYQYLPEKQAAFEAWAQEVTAESAATAWPVDPAQNRELALHG